MPSSGPFEDFKKKSDIFYNNVRFLYMSKKLIQIILSKEKPPANSKKAAKAERNKRKEKVSHTYAKSEQEQGLYVFVISHIESY